MNINDYNDLIINETTLPVISQLSERIPGGFFIYHADGNQELIYFNSHLVSMFGCKDKEEFVNYTGNSFKGIVHPDDYDENEQTIQMQIKSGTEMVDHVKYRFIRKDGSIGMIDDYGHFSHSETFGDIFYVFVQDITEQNKAEHRQRENRREVISQMLGGESTYIVRFKKDTFRILKQNAYLSERYTESEKYSRSISRYIDNDVHEADRRKMHEACDVSGLVKQFETKSEFTQLFRDISSGVSRWYTMRAVKISDDEIAMGFIDIDKKYYDRLLLEKIEDDYFGMYVADLDEQIFKITKSSPWYSVGKTGDVAPYGPALMGFARANEGETRTFFENLCSVDYIRKTFATENKISYTYKSRMVNGNKWVTAECVVLSRHEDGTPSYFALGFKLSDLLASEKNELQEKLNTTRIVMETLTEDFGCVNYVEFKADKSDDICVNYRTSELLKIMVPGWEKEMVFANKIRMLCERVVAQQEKEQFYENVRRERIQEELKDKNIYFVNFKIFYEGEIRYYQMKVSAVRNNGRLTGMVVGIHSVDEYVKKEMAIQAKLEEALESAEVANRSKTKFLFNMSHDIRTPMNAILGFTNMAKKNIGDSERTEDYLEKIETSGQQLLALINQILEMSRIDAGKTELDEKPLDLLREYNSLVTVLSEQARETGLIFNYATENIVHHRILADKAKMNSIVLNIAGNALKYTMKGGTVSFVLKEIPARKEGYATYVLTFTDSGIGMSEEYLKVLFEPFSREQNSTVSKIQGTGLGMAIVKELVRLMGGNIEVSSRLGKGSRFDVTVDFRIDTGNEAVSKPAQNTRQVSFEGRKVLLVEDNEMNREIAQDILEEIGLCVEDADDGTTAVDKLREKGPDYYDFILMDVQMPVMNGYEATKAIRAMYPDAKLPVIALSANAFAEDKAASIASGMDDHVAKPINVKELIDTLAKFMK